MIDPFSMIISGIGSIAQGIGSKSAAKRGYELKKKQIKSQYAWAGQDLLLETQQLIGSIEGAVGASGMRHGSGSPQAVIGDEFEKYELRKNRLMEGEKLEIASAKEGRRQALKGGDLGIALGIGQMASGYYGSDMSVGPYSKEADSWSWWKQHGMVKDVS